MSVCKYFAEIASSTTEMAGLPPNLHTMVPSIARIHGVFKVKVEVRGHVVRALLWCHEMFDVQYLLRFCLYMHSLYEAPLHSPSSVRQLDVMSTSWNELLRHWRSIENRKSSWSTTAPPTLDKKDGELWPINTKVIDAHVDPPKLNFSTDYISALRGCWPLIFLHALEID